MKKTLTVNLGGTVYHIDDDAYRLLDDYLSNLKHFFRKQEGAEEIVNDIVLPSCLPRKCPQGSKSLLLPMWKK